MSICVQPVPVVELYKALHGCPVMIFYAFSIDSDVRVGIVCGFAMRVVRINGRQNISWTEPFGVHHVDLSWSFNVDL